MKASLAWIVVACSSSPSTPLPSPPLITVSGVEDGAVYTSPVTITISVDRGSYSAQLNGADFISGRTVSEPGSYVLVVDARDGEATARSEIAFSITLAGERALIVRVLDLGDNESGGGGDAVLVTDSSGAGEFHLLLDAGPAGVGGADSMFVARRLGELGVDTLEALILTHAHTDHFYGLPAVLRSVHVRRFFWNGQVRSFPRYDATIANAVATADSTFQPGTPVVRSVGGQGSAVFTVLPPFPSYLALPDADGSQINEGSLGTAVALGDVMLFFTGDGEREANARWRAEYPALTASLRVLKVGHHGANDAVFDSGTSGPSSWLDHADPDIGLVSANGRSHPRRGAVQELLARQIETWCTNVHGEITLRLNSEGERSVTVEKNAGEPCAPGTEAGT